MIIDYIRSFKYKEILDNLYLDYSIKAYIDPDPLQFIYNYDDPSDREIVALIASSLALGKVKQIVKSVSIILEKMQNPKNFLMDATLESLQKEFLSFKHRFIKGEELASFLFGVKDVLNRFGTLENCFMNGFKDSDETVFSAIQNFVKELRTVTGENISWILPNFSSKSAYKRLNLFLRWMVRNDNVDPGGWSQIPPSKLIVPLDTHMHKIGQIFGFTNRKGNDMKTALEITEAFKKICPNDPVKYDFVLTRLGIMENGNRDKVLKKLLENFLMVKNKDVGTNEMFTDDMHIMI